MTTRKTERILNLTICLLVSDRYLPKSRIREAVEGYHDLSDAAFERTFERDKAELRAAGVEPDAAQLPALAPSVQASEPAFEPLWNAVLDRTRVSFSYREGE